LFAFQLNDATVDLAQALNNGVRPTVERGKITYFVYKGGKEASMVINNKEFKDLHFVEDVQDILMYKIR
jgi:hypothetical protein